MIYVCRITDISHTTCILRSVHARVLQLLRDGRTCGRHGQTLSIFPLLWFSLSLASLPLAERRDALKPRRRSALTASSSLTSRFGARATSRRVSLLSRLLIGQVTISAQKWSFDERFVTQLFLLPFLWIRWMFVTHRWSAADQATLLTTQSAQRAHGASVHP